MFKPWNVNSAKQIARDRFEKFLQNKRRFLNFPEFQVLLYKNLVSIEISDWIFSQKINCSAVVFWFS
jgi:hypothetical protein